MHARDHKQVRGVVRQAIDGRNDDVVGVSRRAADLLSENAIAAGGLQIGEPGRWGLGRRSTPSRSSKSCLILEQIFGQESEVGSKGCACSKNL
jgi:hypothetical protein